MQKLILLFSCLLSIAQANTIYVAPHGNDKNPGTLQKPLATLEAARDKARNWKKTNEPIEIIIAPGDYYMQQPLLLGEQDGNVTYRAVKPNTVNFYGGIKLPAFTAVNEKLWKCRVKETARFQFNFQQLYVNGKRAQWAKYPDSGFFRIRKVPETILNAGTDAEILVQKILLYPEQVAFFKSFPASVFEDAIFTFYHKWNTTRKKNIRFSAHDSALYLVSGAVIRVNKVDSNSLFTVENIPAAFNHPGEWWLDKNGDCYYIPRPGETIQNTVAHAPANEYFVKIEGSYGKPVQNIRFENLAFKVSAYNIPVNGNNPKQGAAFTDAAIMVNHARNIHFKNCEVAHTGHYAIWFRDNCAESSVRQSYLHDLGAGAIKIGPSVAVNDSTFSHHITVDNNIIRSLGHTFGHAVAIGIFHASDNIVTHNEIADHLYSGISVGWIWGYAPSRAKRNTIQYNHIHHLGWGLISDMGGVYTLAPSEGTIVSDNVIHHIYAATYGGWGLYTDEGSTGITMENNLVYACKSGGFHQHYGKENIVRNNIFASQLLSQLEASRKEPHTGFYFTRNIVWYEQGQLGGIRWEKVNSVVDSNAYWDTRTENIKVGAFSFSQWQDSGRDVHSIIANPAFANRKALDFRFTPASQKVLKAIGFIPFDFKKAGVYGDPAWIRLAQFDQRRAEAFDRLTLH